MAEATEVGAPSLRFSVDELAGFKNGRQLLMRLAMDRQACSSNDLKNLYDTAMRLLFCLKSGRTIWAYMTAEQHDALLARTASPATTSHASTTSAVELVRHLHAKLQEVPFQQKARSPRDINDHSYDLSFDSKDLTGHVLSTLWTMLLSDLTCADVVKGDGDHTALMSQVTQVLKLQIELTIRAEVLCMLKILFPRLGFAGFMTSPLIEGDNWLSCLDWVNYLSNTVPFATAALPQKKHSGRAARLPDVMHGLATEAVWHNSSRFNVPIREASGGVARTVLSLSELDLSIDSYEAAVAHLAGKVRNVSPATDDIDRVRGGFERYQKRIFNAMVLSPEDANKRQQEQMDRYVEAVSDAACTLKGIEAQSWMIAKEVLSVQQYGIPLSKGHTFGLTDGIDDKIKCSERVERMIHALRYDKAICLDMADHEKRLRFVAPPNTAVDARQRTGKRTAAARAANTTQEASNVVPVPQPLHFLAPQPPPTLNMRANHLAPIGFGMPHPQQAVPGAVSALHNFNEPFANASAAAGRAMADYPHVPTWQAMPQDFPGAERRPGSVHPPLMAPMHEGLDEWLNANFHEQDGHDKAGPSKRSRLS